jgi:putative oxidoreductase
VFSDPGTFYQALPFTFLVAAVLVLVFGPGWFALDTLIARRCSMQGQPQEDTPGATHLDVA